MTDSYSSELRDLIDRTFVSEFGGRATAQMVQNNIYGELPEHLTDYLIGKGIAAEIGRYFRAKDPEGMPKRPKVNADGEHAQYELLSADELAFLYCQYRDASDANKAQAAKVRERCLARYGVDLASQPVSA